eukprot:CAMPEP_0117439532 /NCGR_PEP_ID=MMETSP0759-20121206/2613_1 /TAXON_ID=63605 /ORGANISM="Percolomonas cosmopolitus, Strain WS" /LENGTH=1042 /DNA_ID=CAMNT_0005231249 /DNA_START=447 /DNA_END=3575 /DNA_ORIENTATION=+
MSNPSLNAVDPSEINQVTEMSPLVVNVRSSSPRNGRASPSPLRRTSSQDDDLMDSHADDLLLATGDENVPQDYGSLPLNAAGAQTTSTPKRPMISFLFFLVTLALTLLACLLYYYNVFASWNLLFICGGALGWIFSLAFFGSLTCLVSWNGYFLSSLARAKKNATPADSWENTHRDIHLSPLLLKNADALARRLKLKKSILDVSKIVFFVAVTIIGVVGVLVLLISSLVWWIVKDNTLANRAGVLQYSQLTEDVRVERDQKTALIHIYAKNDEDLFFAQGVVAAQERLWQLEFNKRVGQGRLSEIIGDVQEVKDIDRFMRTTGFYRSAQRDWKVIQQLDQKTRVSVERFTEGVNAYVDSGDAQTPIEFSIFGVAPKPWTPEDVITWIKLMSYDLSANAKDEARRYDLMLKGTPYDRVRELFPFYNIKDGVSTTVLSRKDLGIDHLTPAEIQAIEERLRDESGSHIPEKASEEATRNVAHSIAERISLLAGSVHGEESSGADARASNNWVVGPGLTQNGAPLLCNDPHLGLTSPSIWYLVHLHSPNINAVGAALPSVPGIIIGRNSHISWGVTNAFADVQDLFVLDEVDEDHYKHPSCEGGVCAYNIIEEEIVVKGGDNINLKVRESVYGSVINDVMGLSHSKEPISLWWSTLQLNDTTFICVSKLMVAENWQDFTEALKFYVAPSQNFIFADAQNNIGYFMPGKVPIRKRGHTGRFPVAGNGQWDYIPSETNPDGDFIPFEKLPHVFNPEKGFVVSANNRIPPLGYEYAINFDHAPSYRAERIVQMVHEFAGNHTVDTMRNMQMDTFSLLFRDMQFMWNDTEIIDLLPEQYRDEWKVLADWDGNTIWGSQPATLFEGLWSRLRMLPKEKEGMRTYYLMFQWLLTILQQHHVDPVCEKHRSCRQYVVNSFVEMVDELRASDHGNIPMWAVDCHESLFDHSILGKSPLKCLASRSIKNIGGTMTVNVANSGEDYVSTEGVSYRQIVSWDNVEHNSRFIAAPGQSGNMLESTYDIWLEMWRLGEYIPMTTNSTSASVYIQRLQKK